MGSPGFSAVVRETISAAAAAGCAADSGDFEDARELRNAATNPIRTSASAPSTFARDKTRRVGEEFGGRVSMSNAGADSTVGPCALMGSTPEILVGSTLAPRSDGGELSRMTTAAARTWVYRERTFVSSFKSWGRRFTSRDNICWTMAVSS
jgi:hypothetical protein